MARQGGSWQPARRLWRRVVGLGAVPWLIAALLVGASTVAVLVVHPPEATSLPPSSRQDIERLLASGTTDVVTDSDLDGLPDTLENYAYGSDPHKWNSTGSPIPDGWLADWGFDPLDPAAASRAFAAPPSDKLPPAYHGVWPAESSPTLLQAYRFQRPENWSEEKQGPFRNGIDPRQWDANKDGLPDGWLLAHGVDPRTAGLADQRLAGPTGLTVREAFEAGTDPTALDSDGDGLADTDELAGRATWDGRALSFHPSDPAAYSTTATGVCDGYLAGHGLDPTKPHDALADVDNDGATTQQEFNFSRAALGPGVCRSALGLDPARQESGTSGIPDGWFIRYGLDPLDAGIADRPTDSAATDGAAAQLKVRDEYAVNRPTAWDEAHDGPWNGGSDPTKADSDGDGLGDAEEILGWTANVTLLPGGAGRPVHVSSDPTRADADGDGLPDGAERANRTHPQQRDTDFDGIADGEELALDLELAASAAEAAAGAGPGEEAAARPRLNATRADSAGDLLRDGERLQRLRDLQALLENGDLYPFPGGPSGQRSFAEVAGNWSSLPTWQGHPGAGTPLATLFGPGGDLDGDGVANLLDSDLDEDGLPNGVEAKPELYEDAGFPPSAVARSATDPANPDTDGDGLLDGWEVENGAADLALGVNDPDPALYNTDGKGLDDGHEDPDHDSIHVVSFEGGARSSDDWKHDNLHEQQYRTDPHEASSDGDGLKDGWKVYWGVVYGGARGAQVPTPGVAQPAVVLHQDSYLRFTATTPAERLPGEELGTPVTVHLPGLGARTVTPVTTLVNWTFQAVQENGTNPYEEDTDHDGLADTWEVYESSHLRSLSDVALAGCVGTGGPDPLASDAGLDRDNDGLSAAEERLKGSDPLCADSDLGGLDDGTEKALDQGAADPTDDAGGNDPTRDTDGDGLTDRQELDLDPQTDPSNPDTDGDGLLDGHTCLTADCQATTGPGVPAGSDTATRFLSLGIAYQRITVAGTCTPAPCRAYRFLGEQGVSQPTVPDTRIPGVPDGWTVSHTGSGDDWAACYRYGLPLWWDLALHGPWWGGAVPDANKSCASLTQATDADGDGLRDASGEDPIPVASHDNTFPLEPPFDLSPTSPDNVEKIRQRAQAVVVPSLQTDLRVQRQPYTGPPVTLPPASLSVSSVPAAIVRGEQADVVGRLADASGRGIVGATVIARIDTSSGEDYGANFTQADGLFRIPVALRGPHAVPVPSGGVLRSQISGTAAWDVPPSSLLQLTAGRHDLVLVSYGIAAHGSQPAAGPAPPLVRPLTVRHQANLTVTAPETVRPGQSFTIHVAEKDKAELPLADPVRITWDGSTFDRALPTGQADIQLTAPLRASKGLLNVTTVPGADVLPATATKAIFTRDVATLAMAPVPSADAGGTIAARGSVRLGQAGIPGAPVHLRFTTAEGVLLAEANATSGPDGAFAAVLPVPADAPAGRYLLSASLPAAGDHSEAAGGIDVRVRGRTAILESSPPSLPSSGKRLLTARLVDSSGLGVPGRALSLDLDGTTVDETTGDDGQATFVITQVLPSGPHRQTLSFAGDASYTPSALARERTVKGPTRLQLVAHDGEPGAGLPATVRLTDERGEPLAQRVVTVTLGDGSSASALTLANGTARVVVPLRENAAVGATSVRARFSGDGPGSYAAAENRSVARIVIGTVLDLPPGAALVGQPSPVGHLLDTRGRPLAGAPVLVTGPSGATLLKTGPDGNFTLLPQGVPGEPDDLPMAATYAGDAGHAPATARFVLPVRRPAFLLLDGAAPTFVSGEPGAVDVRAIDTAGRPIADGLVRLAIDGVEVAAPVHAGAAHLAFHVPPAAKTGVRTIRLTLDNPTYAAPDLVAGVPVVARTVLEASAGPRRADGLVHVTLHATSGGKAMAGAPLLVHVAGLAGGLTVVTDEDGKAGLDLPVPDSAQPMRVRFDGSATASPATLATALDPSLLRTVQPGAQPLAWVLAGTLALALLVAAAAVAARRRRHPVLQALLAAQRMLEARGLYEADILACYAALQDHLVAAGVLRGPAATPRALSEELARRVPLGDGRPALDRLITVFEVARYSRRATGPAERDAALGALRTLRRTLMRAGLGAIQPEVGV